MGRQAPPELVDFLREAAKRVRIERAVLFGSRARGDAFEHSDFDLILVSPDFEGQAFHARAAPFHLMWRGPSGLDLLCYTPQEFEAKRRGVNTVSTAVAEGIEVTA